jgi:hypothetical protein
MARLAEIQTLSQERHHAAAGQAGGFPPRIFGVSHQGIKDPRAKLASAAFARPFSKSVPLARARSSYLLK